MILKERKIYPTFKVKVNMDELVFEDLERFKEYLIPLDGKELYLTIKPSHKTRSRHEEKYFHAVVCTLIGQALGVSAEEAKELLKNLFLKVEELSPLGFRYERVLSTTELSDKAYHEFIFDKVIPWAALPTEEDGLSTESGLELRIPLPNEVDYENY